VGLLLWAQRPGDIIRLLHSWRAAVAACGGQMRAVPDCQLTYEAEQTCSQEWNFDLTKFFSLYYQHKTITLKSY